MKLFIFDMGGVVSANVHCLPAMASRLGLSAEEFAAASGASASPDASPYEQGDILALEAGALEAQEFWLRFQERTVRLFPERGIRLPLRSDGSFEDLWATYFKPRLVGETVALIRDLQAAGYRVVCGTNTLAVHYDIHRSGGDYSCFAEVYASHLMGVAKPDAAFWRRILEAEGSSPRDAFFTDDAATNVAAAASLGLAVHHFRDAAGLRSLLVDTGALSA